MNDLPPLGLVYDQSDSDYHSGPGISKSGLDLIHQSPELYRLRRRHFPPEPDYFMIGKALHCLALEPEKFDKRYTMEPVDAPRRPTATQLNAKKPSAAALAAIDYWQQFDADNEGKQLLSTKPGKDPFWHASEWCQVHRMADSLRLHPLASVLLEPKAGPVEVSIYWQDKDDDHGARQWTGRLCKCRPDKFNTDHNVVVDLKTTAKCASLHDFTRSAGDFRYHVQDAWYQSGYYQATGKTVDDFLFVVVEKSPPYGVAIYNLDPTARQAGHEEALRDLDLYNKCLINDDWPSYPEEIRTLSLSKWQLASKIR